METIITTSLMALMGVLGIVVYSLFKAKDYIGTKSFVLAIFIKDNLAIWVWSLCVIITLAIVLLIEPTANEVMKQLAGLDLTNTKTGWLLFGAGLCGLFRNVKK